MNKPWYFLSYAKLDAANDPYRCISRFYEDLDKDVRKLKVIKEGEAGFFDRKGLQQGSNWPTALVDALSTCRVLICVYSPAFFESDYCGREWQIFNSRFSQASKDSVAEAQKPLLILPVLFRPPEDLDNIPLVLQDIQYDDDDYPAEYSENGLLYLMKRDSKKEAYLDFLDTLVDKIIKATTDDQQPLPELNPRPDIKSIKSAFHYQPEPPPMVHHDKPEEPPLPTTFGPKYAQFLYVAACREEVSLIKPVSPRIDYYGDESLHWKPYWPVETQVELFAQYVASREGFRYDKISLETDLVSQIKEAQANKRIVVVVVDTWTLFLEKYRQSMRDYDDASFWNSVLLVVWNDNDPAVANNRDALEEVLKKTFTTKMIIKDNRYFVADIRNASDLETRLSVALQTLLAQIINAETMFKKIANAQNISKPEIPAPGGATV
jgi:FxsC-like protein